MLFRSLRNVFQLNPQHEQARVLYANTQLDEGEIAEAYGQIGRASCRERVFPVV